MNEQKDNFLRKNRKVVSFFLSTCICIILSVIIIISGQNSGDRDPFGFAHAFYFYIGVPLSFILSFLIINTILHPITSVEIAHDKLITKKINTSNKLINIISWILILSVLYVALYICNRYFGFIK